MSKHARWALIAGVGTIAVLVAIHVALTSLGSQRRSQSVEGLRRKVEQVLSEEPAPAEPGPTAPVAPAEPEVAKDEEAISVRWQRVFALTRERFGDDPWYPEENAEANSALALWGAKSHESLTAEELESLEELMQANAGLLSETLALTQPDVPLCRFLSYEQDNRYFVLELLLAADVLLRAATGDYDQVIRDITSQTRMSQADPYHDTRLVSGDIRRSIIGDALHSGTVSDALWDTLLVELERSRDRDVFVDGWAREAAATLEWYDNLPHSASGSVTQRPWQRAQMWAYRYAGAPLLQYNERVFAEAMTELLDLAPLPYYEAKPALDRIRDAYGIDAPWDLPPWRREPGSLVVSTLAEAKFSSQAEVEVDIDLARMAILLERYRTQHGAYPETLDAIAGGLGGAVPLNPFLGEPYQYERQADTFVLSYRYVGAMRGLPAPFDGMVTRIWPAYREPPGSAGE